MSAKARAGASFCVQLKEVTFWIYTRYSISALDRLNLPMHIPSFFLTVPLSCLLNDSTGQTYKDSHHVFNSIVGT